MRYTSKQTLIDDIQGEYDRLRACLRGIPTARWSEPGVWGDGWTVSDLVAHLAEWQRMFLGWHADGLKVATPQMPAPGFKWNDLPSLNRAIWQKHRSRTPASVRADLASTHGRVLRLAGALSPAQLLEPGHFAWTGKNSVTTYLGANTASHYRFAIKVLERWLRAVGP